jgi:hypothetical protein
MGREAHHPTLAERFAEDPAPPQDPSPVASMCHRLQTKAGKARYALRGGLTRRSGVSSGYPMVTAADELSRLIVQG